MVWFEIKYNFNVATDNQTMSVDPQSYPVRYTENK